jgi:hypothetical protein
MGIVDSLAMVFGASPRKEKKGSANAAEPIVPTLQGFHAGRRKRPKPKENFQPNLRPASPEGGSLTKQ